MDKTAIVVWLGFFGVAGLFLLIWYLVDQGYVSDRLQKIGIGCGFLLASAALFFISLTHIVEGYGRWPIIVSAVMALIAGMGFIFVIRH